MAPPKSTVTPAFHRALGRVQLWVTGLERFAGPDEATLTTTFVTPPGALIGRDPEADVCLVNCPDLVSRRHCVIEASGSGWMVRDWDSSYGTALRVGGQEPMQLPNGIGWVLGEGMWIVLAGCVELKTAITQPAARGKKTAAAGTSESAITAPLLSDEQLRLAAAFTRPYRELPPRHDHLPVDALADELSYSRRTIYLKLDEIASSPAIAAALTIDRGNPGRLRELSDVLIQLYPGLGGPGRIESPG
jgi:predicted component of type VI protein secretion system